MTIYDLTLAELRAKLDNLELSAVEVTNAYLDRIATTNPELNSFITVCDETAIAEAQAADQAIAAGEVAPLTGLPIAVKDIFNTAGLRTTCASRILENYVSPYDASNFPHQGAKSCDYRQAEYGRICHGQLQRKQRFWCRPQSMGS